MLPGGTTPSGSAPLNDRYRALVPLGRGGMGTVELAVERSREETGARGVERIVALKRLLPDAKARHAEMFLREARLAVLLDHPNVVRAYDFGELGGELFMAMEYVEGEPLSRVIATAREKGMPLEPVLVARMLAEVCDGLHAAHELVDESGIALRVVHRDVSPHNVMIAYDGQVKLLDFGVAKIEAEHGLTRTGEVKGKAAYMSPEQAMGDPLDRRSDLYSLGAVLYECIAGHRMWEGTDMDVMRKLALEATPKLETLPELAARVPDALARVFDRLVSKLPAGRPETAADVARELRLAAGELRRDRDVTRQELALLMARLFEGDARSRRADLERALAGVDSSHAEELRKSLAPGRGSRSTPALVPARSPSRAVVIVGIVFALAVVTGVVASSMMSRSSTPVVSERVVPPTSTSTSTATATAAAKAAPETSAAAKSAAEASTSTSSASASARRGLPRVEVKPAVKVVPKPPASSKPLDVDPHAI